MTTKLKILMIAGATLLTLPLTSLTADAKGRKHRYADSYDRGDSCEVNYDRGNSHRNSYSTTCRPIHTCYVTRGCDLYEVTTYLHTETDCYGRVVLRWKTKKTVFVGDAHH